ncbi:hypothetical protein [Lysinibacillus sp. 54212]|uniref:hypothetical protein n=1 Tax=Lysinibacillus sp. 54212 TaxID=3119829 RepID=UPI002FC6E09A
MARKNEAIKEKNPEVFVLYFDGKPMNLVRWVEYSPKLKSNARVPKAIYWTEGQAKTGIANLPVWIDRNLVTIEKFIPEKENLR